MKTEFALAFNELLEDKQLPKEVIQSAIESAMIEAYRKAMNASKAQDVSVSLDFDTGDVKVFAEKEVTDMITDFRTEVLLEDAQKIDPDIQMGDVIMVESTPENFGRVAAQNARQKIQQMIHDAEKKSQVDFYSKQVGEIVSGVVQAVNARGATIGLDLKAEGVMLRKDMIPRERLKIRERIRALIYEVEDSQRGPQILMSRAHRNFLRRMLEIEVPEIYHGVVEIRSIAREPGERAKVSVSASQQGIDPVGACVGKSGVRIQSIVRELHNEKIDVIEWNKDPAIYIAKAISPARVSGVYLNSETEDNKTATVIVPEDQLSLAIGREGQNARLAAKLTGWRIDIMSITEAAAKTLVKVRKNQAYAAILENEAEMIARVDDLLQKKTEGRAISIEDNTLLTRFVDRIEKREEADRKADDIALQAKVKEIKEGIPEKAFDLSILDIDYKEYIQVILQEAGIETLGDLMLQLQLDPDKVLACNGIGPKTFDELTSFVEAYEFPAEVVDEELQPAAETVEIPAEASAEGESGASDTEVEGVNSETSTSEEKVSDDEKVEGVAEAEEEEEVPFEDLFKVDAIKYDFSQTEGLPDEDDGSGSDDKRKKGKKKKGYHVEFDPEIGETTVKRTHKRDDDTWKEW